MGKSSKTLSHVCTETENTGHLLEQSLGQEATIPSIKLLHAFLLLDQLHASCFGRFRVKGSRILALHFMTRSLNQTIGKVG